MYLNVSWCIWLIFRTQKCSRSRYVQIRPKLVQKPSKRIGLYHLFIVIWAMVLEIDYYFLFCMSFASRWFNFCKKTRAAAHRCERKGCWQKQNVPKTAVFFPQAFVLAYFYKWAYGIRLKHKSQTPKLLRKKQRPSSNSLYTHGLSSHTKTLNLPINRSNIITLICGLLVLWRLLWNPIVKLLK